MELNEDSTWPSITELVNYPLASESPADKAFYVRLRRAHAANPEGGARDLPETDSQPPDSSA